MQMKAAIEQAQQKQQGPAGNAEAIVNFYGGLFKFLLSETDHISLAVSAGAEKCEVALVISAVPGTDMAKMLGTSEGSAGDYKGMLGYLDNGAIINLATIIDHEAMKTMYSGMFDLFGAMGGETMGEADAAKLKESTVRMVDSLGDSLAFSFTVGDGGTGPFSMREVVSVKDEKLFREVLEEQIEMMNEGAFKNLYKSFGMDMDMKVKRATGTYKGVSIDSATVTFSMGDENSPQSEMVRKMWGDGIQYRWALLDGYCVYAVGSKVDEAIRELIDQVRAGGPGEVKSEMKAALEAIGDSDEADTVGTVNIARMIKMGLGIMPIPAEAAAKIEIQSKSNIVFAGKGGVLRMVVPKEHLLELKSAIETMGKQAKQQGQ